VVGVRRGVGVLVLVVGLTAAGGARLGAASPVQWSGAGDHVHWSDPANWVGGVVPADGDAIVLAATAAKCPAPEGLGIIGTVDDLGPGLNLAGIALSGPCGFSVQGHAITLSGPVRVPGTSFFGQVELQVPVTLAADIADPSRVSFDDLDLAGHDIVSNEGGWFAGPVHDSVGGSTITITGGGRVLLEGGGGYAVSVEGGTADVFSAADVTMTSGSLSFIGATSVHATGGTLLIEGNDSVTGDLFTSPDVTFAAYGALPHHGDPLAVGGQFTMDGNQLLVDIQFDNLPGEPDPVPGAVFTVLHTSTSTDLGTFAGVPDGTLVHDQFGRSTWRINYLQGGGFTVTATLVSTDPPPTTTTTTIVPSSTTTTTSATTTTTAVVVGPASTVVPTTVDPSASSGDLPVTGSSDILWFALVGVVLLTAGAALVRTTRRSDHV
jgi:LPXTG-motif cell wall-anchored protein